MNITFYFFHKKSFLINNFNSKQRISDEDNNNLVSKLNDFINDNARDELPVLQSTIQYFLG